MKQPSEVELHRLAPGRKKNAVLWCLALVVAITVSIWKYSPIPLPIHPLPIQPPVDSNDPFGTQQWKQCPDNLEYPLFQCGALPVPLDHLNKTGNRAKIDIAVIRLKSTAPKVKGTILVNPGGPGGSGIDLVARAGFLIKTITGGEFDILGFDPRGIGQSQSVSCSQTPLQHSANSLLQAFSGVPNGLDESISVNKYDALVKLSVAGCKTWSNDLIPFISTAYTARDMDAIRVALNELELNFFGFSYGTFLGITYVNMFPDRVGRVIIDGVTDPQTFAGNYIKWSFSSLVNTPDGIDAFSRFCAEAGPTNCPLTKLSDNDFSVIQRIRKFIYFLADNPIPVSDGNVTVLITADNMNSYLFQNMYTPASWPVAARALAKAIFQQDFKDLAIASGGLDGQDRESLCPLKDESGNFGFLSVKCNDGFSDDETSLEEYEEGAKVNSELSEFGGSNWVWMGLGCKYWPSKAVERYDGQI
ncbi:UNVERIFIED_CONTAM: hypothetical protein HDU68_005220 [Siphonaria sp. JEL0065]|nr:hypothetical protein HDU68_005220 [Siphonaria sp. JEL0065]